MFECNFFLLREIIETLNRKFYQDFARNLRLIAFGETLDNVGTHCALFSEIRSPILCALVITIVKYVQYWR